MREVLAKTYLDQAPTGELFEQFTADAAALLPKTIRPGAVAESVEHLAGSRLTREVLTAECWRLAGNIKLLVRGDRVPPWTRQPCPEWVPVQVAQARRRRGAKGDPGWLFVFQILAGLSAGLRTERFWTDKFCRMLAKDMGFSRQRLGPRSRRLPRNQYQHPLELVTLRLHVLIEPRLCDRELPGFERTRVSGSNLEWNREQLKFRDRFDEGYECPKGQPHAVPCFRCPFGVSSCRAAVHQVDYVFDYCQDCGEDNAPFDKALSDERCVNCYERRAMMRRG